MQYLLQICVLRMLRYRLAYLPVLTDRLTLRLHQRRLVIRLQVLMLLHVQLRVRMTMGGAD